MGKMAGHGDDCYLEDGVELHVAEYAGEGLAEVLHGVLGVLAGGAAGGSGGGPRDAACRGTLAPERGSLALRVLRSPARLLAHAAHRAALRR